MQWYIAEVFRRECGAEPLWSVTFRRLMERELFEINGRIFIVNAKERPLRNMGSVLRILSLRRAGQTMALSRRSGA